MKSSIVPIALALLLPAGVFASQFVNGGDYTLPRGEQVSENFYVAGGAVTLVGDVAGDVVAAGGTILVSGAVGQDIVAAGGEVTIAGTVSGDVRLAGGQVVIEGAVGGDVVAAGGTVRILPGATIGGEVLAAAGDVAIEGVVTGGARLAGDRIVVSGAVHGPLRVLAGSDFVVKGGAVLHGPVTYKASREATIEEGATLASQPVFTPYSPKQEGDVLSKFWLVKLFMALATGLVLYFISRSTVVGVVTSGVERFWKELLRGFAAFVLIPIASVLLIVTVLGAPLGVLGLIAYIGLSILSWVFSGMILGLLCIKTVRKKRPAQLSWSVVLGGSILLVLLVLIPFIGWIIAFAFFLVAFGSIVRPLYQRIFSA